MKDLKGKGKAKAEEVEDDDEDDDEEAEFDEVRSIDTSLALLPQAMLSYDVIYLLGSKLQARLTRLRHSLTLASLQESMTRFACLAVQAGSCSYMTQP